VRAIGVSNFDVNLVTHCEAIRHVDSLQPPFSLINRAAADTQLPWCASHDTGVICYSPMQSGLLTDSFTADRMSSLAADDWRHRAPEFKQPHLRRNLLLRDALRPIAKRHDTSVSAIAIAWTLAWTGVTGAIVGARTPTQVDGWIGAASIELAPQDLDGIARAIQQTGAGVGPAQQAAAPPASQEVAR
jgi:aryl-alcohol dehydrogenase-like predicted oxidoreductase